MMSTCIPFETVIAAHGDTVMRVCLSVLAGTHGSEDAEDAWAETFLSALRAWPSLPADADVEAWLVTIAHRRAVDVIRRRTRRRETALDAPEDAGRKPAAHPGASASGAVPVSAATSGTSAPAADAGVEAGAEVWAQVAALPRRQREAIGYHYLGGLSHVQTAELIGSSPAAVRRAAADGMRTLRRLLRADEDERDAT